MVSDSKYLRMKQKSNQNLTKSLIGFVNNKVNKVMNGIMSILTLLSNNDRPNLAVR